MTSTDNKKLINLDDDTTDISVLEIYIIRCKIVFNKNPLQVSQSII